MENALLSAVYSIKTAISLKISPINPNFYFNFAGLFSNVQVPKCLENLVNY